jgi:hypothetical protein
MRRAAILVCVIACGGEPTRAAASLPATDDVDSPVRALFERHAKALADHELVTTIPDYAPAYVLSLPAGSAVVRNDDDHRSVVAAEDAYFAITLRLTSAQITYLEQTRLGPRHALVRTRLGCTFERSGDRMTELPRTYLVDLSRPRAPVITGVVIESDEASTFHAIGLF